MKKIITLSIYLLVITSSFASNFNTINVSKKDNASKMEITLTLNDVVAGQKLSIKDENGIILFNKTIETSGTYNNRFDLSELPDGDYHFEHENTRYTKHIPFTVAFGEVKFDNSNARLVYKPHMRVKNNHIYLSKLDLERSDVVVDIYYAKNNGEEYQLLHTEDINDSIKVERIYRISDQYKGDYKVVVNANNGQSYVEHFKI